jgi:predicted XRE-type DNA-binding protein
MSKRPIGLVCKEESMRMSARDEENKVVRSSGNVFADLGFDDAQSQVLALRADLMAQLDRQIKARNLTQVETSRVLGVSQSRVSDLSRGKVEKFSLDMLVQFAAKLGKPARIELAR